MDYMQSIRSAAFRGVGALRLLIVVGTRPEIIRLSAVIARCRASFDCILAHTGQNYDYNLSGIFFDELGIAPPDVYLDVAGDDLGTTLGNIISRSYQLMAHLRPEALLVLGDTNSCLCAMAAKRLHIPIFHMEAGNRCFDECLPEESNRRVIDTLSDVNLAYSEQARHNLLSSGAPAARTLVTGSPMAEVLRANLPRIRESDVLSRLGLQEGKYLLLSAHREENIDNEDNFRALFGAINTLARTYDMPVLYSCHPRSRKRLQQSGISMDARVRLHEPLGFHDYNRLQLGALAVISDSGTLPEEASFYAGEGTPIAAVCIRSSPERPEAMEAGCFTLAGIDEQGLVRAVALAVDRRARGSCGTRVPAYADEQVSERVVNIIASYTGIVRRDVWHEHQGGQST